MSGTIQASVVKDSASSVNNISLDASGNATFGAKVLGDYSNATVASRSAFQTSTTNASTGIYALPNGTSTAASWQATNAADPTNASKILIATNGSTDVQLVSGINGTGTYLPLSFYTNGTQQMQLSTAGILTGTAGNLMLVQGTAVASTSGTSITFTGIPTWAKRIIVMFNGVSTTGTSPIQIQVGSGSVTTTGYSAQSGNRAVDVTSTTGFPVTVTNTAASLWNGIATLALANSSTNAWVMSGTLDASAASSSVNFSAGGVSLSGVLDRVVITTVGGTDTFDAGTINIQYE
jgi:hypothetical protein